MKLLLIALFLADTNVSVVEQIAHSGRCLSSIENPDNRVLNRPDTVVPGPPPLLSFRLYEGKQHGRFGNADLMLDDAGH